MQTELMNTETRRSRAAAHARRVLPVVIVALLGVLSLLSDTVLKELDPAAAAEVAPIPDGWGWLCAVLIMAQAAAMWFRSERPRFVFALVTVLDLATIVISSAQLSVGTIAVMIAAYTVWRRDTPRRSAAWLLGAAVISAVVATVSYLPTSLTPAQWALPLAVTRAAVAFAIPAIIGEIVRSRSRLLEALQDRAALAEREQERTAREAVQQERALMARELHDIAAHHLSGIIVGAQAASALVTDEPDRAQEYLRSVRVEAQQTLANLRHTVGLLRTDGNGELAPVPSLDQVATLVEVVQESGLDVGFTMTGTPVALGPIAEVAGYRMVQESLTNARAHAPGASITVSLDYTGTAAELVVENARPGTSPAGRGAGNGLLGMHERATLITAKLSTGPTPSGGWRNALEIPYPDTDAQEGTS